MGGVQASGDTVVKSVPQVTSRGWKLMRHVKMRKKMQIRARFINKFVLSERRALLLIPGAESASVSASKPTMDCGRGGNATMMPVRHNSSKLALTVQYCTVCACTVRTINTIVRTYAHAQYVRRPLSRRQHNSNSGQQNDDEQSNSLFSS